VSWRPLAQHGDVRYMNVLLGDEHVGFLDWEYYGRIEMPCYDLLSLLLDAFFTDACDRPFDARAVRRNTPALQRSLSDYFDIFALAPSHARHLLQWTLFQQFVAAVNHGESSTGLYLKRIELLRNNDHAVQDRLLALLPRN
jgi:thiamine kinase-like enzyme